MASTQRTATPSLAVRRRLRDMRRVQEHAVALFDEHGFDQVSVERVAAAAGVSPVSIYRWFRTKEGLILWDDYDPGLLVAVAGRLRDGDRPLVAVRTGIAAELDRVYDADRELVLARTKLIHREPALLSAARDNGRLLDAALRGLFADAQVGRGDFDRAVLAAVAVGVLVTAVEAWQARDGRVPLADLVAEGFAVVEADR